LQSITALLDALQSWPWAVFIHKKAWAFTTVQVVHFFTVSAWHDSDRGPAPARLCRGSSVPLQKLSRQLLPFTWTAFVLTVITGSLMFISQATEYFANPVFWFKMSVIVLTGINMMIFEFVTVRDVEKWNLDLTPPPRARLAGGISIACWALVIVLGRVISFTLSTE